MEPAGAKAQRQQCAGPGKVIWHLADCACPCRFLTTSLEKLASECRSPVALVLGGVLISSAGGHKLGGAVVDGKNQTGFPPPPLWGGLLLTEFRRPSSPHPFTGLLEQMCNRVMSSLSSQPSPSGALCLCPTSVAGPFFPSQYPQDFFLLQF